jgi:hypothetical protein
VVYGQPKKQLQHKRNVWEYKSNFQVSLFPGISTNGTRSGSYLNQYSFNVFGGLSGGNRILEASPFSNINLRSNTGIQFAGLANIVGANAFVNLTISEERDLMHEDFQCSVKGIQISGLLNYVRDNFSGIQFTGLLNAVGNDFKGVQLSGLGNSAGGFLVGFQLASLYNVAKESIAGIQLSALFNYTDGQLSGTQVSLINRSRIMTGKKSTPPTKARSLQIGLLNLSKAMDGVQIGLINFGGTVRGKQIGLINFFSKDTPHEMARNGTPIGLLNLGSSGSYLRFSSNELFIVNLEHTTGNCLNCSRVFDSQMPFNDRNQIFNQNALIVGYDPINSTWGFGYGFQKVLYNKVVMYGSPLNKTRVITYGLKGLHLNRSLSFDQAFNLLTRLNVDYGERWRGKYWFVGLSMNYFMHERSELITDFKIRSASLSAGKFPGLAAHAWPGYELGVQF